MSTPPTKARSATSGEHELALIEEMRRMREVTIPAVARIRREQAADIFGEHTLSQAANLHLEAARQLMTQLEGSSELRAELEALVAELESWAEEPPNEGARRMRYTYAMSLFEKAGLHLKERVQQKLAEEPKP